MIDSENICLACGCCCDGTIIGFVQLERKEMIALKDVMEVEEGNGEGFFLLPCENLGECGCKIYSQRPKPCIKFECGLLNAIERKEISFKSAVEVVEIVKQKKATIQNQLKTLKIDLKSKSFYFQMLELRKLIQKKETDATITESHRELMLDVEQLNQLLGSKFGVSLF